jgi:hypothetical protein
MSLFRQGFALAVVASTIAFASTAMAGKANRDAPGQTGSNSPRSVKTVIYPAAEPSPCSMSLWITATMNARAGNAVRLRQSGSG